MATPENPSVEAAPGLSRALGLAVLAGLVGAVVAAWITGAVAPLALADPGPVVRWGVPLVSSISTLASAATVGLLGLAAFLAPERTRTHRRVTATRYAATAATVWALAALLEVVLTFADLAGTPLTSAGLFDQLVSFTWTLETTRVLLISALVAVVVAVSARVATRRAPMAWLAVFTLVAVVILALTGHAAGSASHEDAVNALGVHLLGVVVWTGGLIALVVMRVPLGSDLGPTVSRYSTVAAWCFAAVALTGLQQAWIRLGSIDGLFTAYGAVVALKTLAIVALGVFGWLHRRNIAEVLTTRPGDGRVFARLAVVELAVMGAATGLAAVLARSVPPVPDAAPAPSRVLELTGYPDPGPMSGADWFTAWRLDWLFLGTAVLAVGLYLAGVCAAAPSWRRVAAAAHRLLGARLGAVRLGHLQRARHLGPRAVQHAHGDAHGRRDDRAAAAGARGAPDPRAARAQAPHRQDLGAARGAAPGGALTGDAGAREPGGGRGVLLLQPGGLLLDRALPALADHPHRAPADDGPLPAHRVPVRLGAHRHRPGPAAVVTAACCSSSCSRRSPSTPSSGWRSPAARPSWRPTSSARSTCRGGPTRCSTRNGPARSPGGSARPRRCSSRWSWRSSGSSATSRRPGARTARPTATATPSSRPTTSTSGGCATRPTTSN